MSQLTVTNKQATFVDKFFENPNGDLVEIAREAGYSIQGVSQVWQLVNTPTVKSLMTDRMEGFLAVNGMQALQALFDVMSDPSQPAAHIKKQAADSILDRLGLAKKAQMEITHQGEMSIAILPEKEVIELQEIEFEVVHENS